MIIWISGAYGVGKSTLADALAERMENLEETRKNLKNKS